jgi:hypothetical protein
MLGKYQFSPPALQDIGFINARRNWTGLMGVRSDEDFLSSPEAQEVAIDRWLRLLDQRISAKGLYDYIGKKIDADCTVTQEGIVAAAHFAGVRGLKEWFEGKRVIEDANGVTPLTYLRAFDTEEEDSIREPIGGGHRAWIWLKGLIKKILRKIILWMLKRLE